MKKKSQTKASTSTLPFPPWPHFGREEEEAALRVLRSGRVNYWTGKECGLFEDEWKDCLGRKHAISLANGTVALELALRALDIGPQDEVIVPSKSFVATASSVMACGAKPVFVDIDENSQNISATSIEGAISDRTKALIAVHMGGWPCDMDPIMELAESKSLRVIEDCAQAHGAKYRGRAVGSLAHVACFSFCQDKIITSAGEGGMLLTDDGDVWRRAWAYKDHGKDYEATFKRQHPPGFRWLHESFGSNFRMTEIQAAVGRVGLANLEGWVERRRELAALLEEQLSGIEGFYFSSVPADCYLSYYRYYAFLDPSVFRDGWTRDSFVDAVCERGTPCFSGTCSEMYLEKAFADHPDFAHYAKDRLPVARKISERVVSFLVHPTLREEDIRSTSDACSRVMDVVKRGS